MSPKLSKFQSFKKNFKDALLKYIVEKFHNFTWAINHTVSNCKWGALEICLSVCVSPRNSTHPNQTRISGDNGAWLKLDTEVGFQPNDR